MNKTITTALSIAAFVGLGLAGCGSSSDDATKKDTTSTAAKAEETTTTAEAAAVPTTAEFCVAADAAFGGFEPNIDAIFEDNPNPTLEDWAAFLPEPTRGFDEVIARLEEVEPSEEVAEDFEAALHAMRVLAGDLHASLDAAKAGDQTAFDAAEEANQGSEGGSGDGDAFGTAIDKVGAYCGGGN